MKLLIALVALASAAPAFACTRPLPIPGHVEPSRSEFLRGIAERHPNIVYAVVERTLTRPRAGPGGAIRILHVYKGSLRVGEIVPMYSSRLRSDCDPPAPLWTESIPRGAYGVLFLPGVEDGRPIEFNEFLGDGDVAVMIRAGIIESARAD